MLTCDAIQAGDIISVTIKGVLTPCDKTSEKGNLDNSIQQLKAEIAELIKKHRPPGGRDYDYKSIFIDFINEIQQLSAI